MIKYKAYIINVKNKNDSSLSPEIHSIPLIFTEEMLKEENFDFNDYIESEYEILFISSYEMLKEQLIAINKLAKSNEIVI